MEEKKTLLEQLSAQLLQLDKELDQLNAKAGQAKAEGKTEWQELMNKLLTKKREALEKFRQLEATGDDAWDDVRAGIEKSWGELKTALSRAWSKLQDDDDQPGAVA
jgi:uncharacterized phage infection (PIP) family protein YhgE